MGKSPPAFNKGKKPLRYFAPYGVVFASVFYCLELPLDRETIQNVCQYECAYRVFQIKIDPSHLL